MGSAVYGKLNSLQYSRVYSFEAITSLEADARFFYFKRQKSNVYSLNFIQKTIYSLKKCKNEKSEN